MTSLCEHGSSCLASGLLAFWHASLLASWSSGMPRFWPPDLLACLASGLFSGSDFTDTTRIPRMVIRDAPVERFGSKHSVVGLGFAFGGASFFQLFYGGLQNGEYLHFQCAAIFLSLGREW